ncbi:hypothetical protein DFH06DRAFT_1008265, partial [Mycena polygramma]
AWLRDSVEVLCRVDLGPHFHSLLETLIRVEELHGFAEMPRRAYPAVSRPVEVGIWIGRHRGTKSAYPYSPQIENVVDYTNRWQQWWDTLQPAWRQRDTFRWKTPETYPANCDWGVLAKPGPNGALGLVASLYFWGFTRNALGPGGGWSTLNQTKWNDALQDVLWVLEGVESSLR